MPDIARAAELLAHARSAVVLTGAGISTESGLPDFRSPGGIWSKHDPREFVFQRYLAEPAVRRSAWQLDIELFSASYAPNNGHRALTQMPTISAVITQNIDGLHQDAGSRTVIELHGTAREVYCLSCLARWPTTEILQRVVAGEDDPPCVVCDGILKLATISFGQHLDAATVTNARRAIMASDVMLVVGSSLEVIPAAAMPSWAVRHGASLIVINREPTPADDIADVVLHGEAGPTLTELAQLVVG